MSLHPRIAFYTHDTFGLGHVRRCLHMIKQLSAELKDASILLVTGSPALSFFKELPQNVDLVKIPTIVKTGSEGSLPPHLKLGLPELIEIRSRIIKETILSFQPHVFIVDNFPLGAQAELIPLLKCLRNTKTKTILGLRDILDCPKVVREEWEKHGVHDILDRYYDKILIYGEQSIFDAVKEYAIPESVAKKVNFCGYLTETGPIVEDPKKLRESLGVEGHFVLATGGGGGDAYPLLSMVIEASKLIPKSTTLIFTGPLMGEQDKRRLKEQINGSSRIIFKEFVPDLRAYIKAADVMVAMCGYNLAAEIVYHRPRAIVAPRTWRFGEHEVRKKTREEKEQMMRAEVLAENGIVELIEPDNLNGEILAQKIEKLLHTPQKSQKNKINMNGLQNAVRHIHELMA